MRVTIVMGAGGTGKTTFATNRFPEAQIVSVGDIQRELFQDINSEYLTFIEHFTLLQEAHDRTVNETIACIEVDKNVVMEHTLFKRNRREEVIGRLRDVTDAPIDIYLMMPSDQQIQKNIESNSHYRNSSVGDVKREMRKIEIPCKDEGFDKIYVVTEKGIEDWTEKTMDKKIINDTTKATLIETDDLVTDETKEIFGNKAFLHICEVCGKTEVLTSKEAFEAGWDYPGIDGIYKCENFKVLTPRTCGNCGIAETAWWALSVEGKTVEELSEMQKLTLERILQEPENLRVK